MCITYPWKSLLLNDDFDTFQGACVLQHLGLQHKSVSLLLCRINDQAPSVVHTEEPHQLIGRVIDHSSAKCGCELDITWVMVTWFSLRAPHKACRHCHNGQGQGGVEQKVVERPHIANVTHWNNPSRDERCLRWWQRRVMNFELFPKPFYKNILGNICRHGSSTNHLQLTRPPDHKAPGHHNLLKSNKANNARCMAGKRSKPCTVPLGRFQLSNASQRSTSCLFDTLGETAPLKPSKF